MNRWRLRIRAVRALRLNYTRKGVYVWLKGRKRLQTYCDGDARETWSRERGYRRLWHDPERVCQEQYAIAEGVFL